MLYSVFWILYLIFGLGYLVLGVMYLVFFFWKKFQGQFFEKGNYNCKHPEDMWWWWINLSESPIKGGTQAGSFSASMVRNKGNYKQELQKYSVKFFFNLIDEVFSLQRCEAIALLSQEDGSNILLKCAQVAKSLVQKNN